MTTEVVSIAPLANVVAPAGSLPSDVAPVINPVVDAGVVDPLAAQLAIDRAALDAENGITEQVVEQPSEKLAGKFDSAKDLEAAYLALQAKLGAPKETPEANPNDAAIPVVTAEVAAAQDVVTKAGLDFAKLNDAFAKDGKLADTDYAALTKVGIPPAMVNSFIAGQIALGQAQAAVITKAAHEAAGGAEKYGEMVKWASTNLDKGQVAAFNKAVGGSDPAVVALAVAGINAAFVKQGGAEPSNVSVAGGKGGQSVYRTTAEMMKDMGDKRYENDAAFRQAVENKLARSKL